jgi:hypothetical protein
LFDPPAINNTVDYYAVAWATLARAPTPTPVTQPKTRVTPAASVIICLRKAGGKMSAMTLENVIIRAIHEAFIKYP